MNGFLKSFCEFKKHDKISLRTLTKMWGYNEVISDRIVEKLIDCNIMSGRTNLRIHDFIFDIIKEMTSRNEKRIGTQIF